MKSTRQYRLWAAGSVFLLALVCFCLAAIWQRNPARGLPHAYTFRSDSLDDWQAFGGTWGLQDGTIRNDSDERGAKILTGSPYWKNYSVEADLELLGTEGDAGLIIRSGDEEDGVDSYRGYYAGLRGQESRMATDNRLIIGKADHQYTELESVPIPGGVVPFRWYHLKLLVYGCRIVASATWPIHSSRTITASATDPDCFTHGRIGLRSYASGGVWRNIQVRPATREDMEKMLAVPPPKPLPPGSRIENEPVAQPAPPISNIVSISDLRLMSVETQQVATVRGVVISTAPRLYIQDSTGGAAVEESKSVSLKIGDEVQATGRVDPGDFSPVLRDATVRVLWTGAPIPPVFATSSQAATGIFDATFIEVKGYVEDREYTRDHVLALRLRDGQQTFQALMYGERAASLFDKLRPGSLVTVRGVCVVAPAYTRNLTPFAVLLRSSDDLNLLQGPPWWSPQHLIAFTIAFFLLIVLGQYIHIRVERWKMRAILEERERLAHEMHDTLAQSFAGIGFQLEAIRDELPSETNAHEHLNLACDLVRHSHEEARRNIASLRPEFLSSLGLIAALERWAARLLVGGTIRIRASGRDEARQLHPLLADTLFRIGQEAIANAVRHAHPSIIEIRLRVSGKTVGFIVEDDGIGFQEPTVAGGFGLEGMRKRAEMISAALSVLSSPGGGTKITVLANLPQQLDWKTIPGHIWSYLKNSHLHGETNAAADPHPYRG